MLKVKGNRSGSTSSLVLFARVIITLIPLNFGRFMALHFGSEVSL
jgi:hypothetical protein